jgi:hypothetical protein
MRSFSVLKAAKIFVFSYQFERHTGWRCRAAYVTQPAQAGSGNFAGAFSGDLIAMPAGADVTCRFALTNERKSTHVLVANHACRRVRGTLARHKKRHVTHRSG